MTSKTAGVPAAAGTTVAGRVTGSGMTDARAPPGGTVRGRATAGRAAAGQIATAGTRTLATPTRRSWKPSHTPSTLATSTPATLPHAAHARALPTCLLAPPGPAPTAACRARPVRRARRARRRETQPPPTAAPGSPPRGPRPAPTAPGRQPVPGPARQALVPGNREPLAFALVRVLPLGQTIPPSPGTPRHPSNARPAPRQPATGARKLTRPAGRSTDGSKAPGASSLMPRAVIRTGPHRRAGNSAVGQSAAAQ
jgi:hypothetical protein